jgi:hypothetical protein
MGRTQNVRKARGMDKKGGGDRWRRMRENGEATKHEKAKWREGGVWPLEWERGIMD